MNPLTSLLNSDLSKTRYLANYSSGFTTPFMYHRLEVLDDGMVGLVINGDGVSLGQGNPVCSIDLKFHLASLANERESVFDEINQIYNYVKEIPASFDWTDCPDLKLILPFQRSIYPFYAGHYGTGTIDECIYNLHVRILKLFPSVDVSV